MKVALFENIPRPYRNPCFARLAELCELKVFFNAWTEPNRDWAFKSSEIPYEFEVIPSVALTSRWRLPNSTARETAYMQFSAAVIPRLARFKPDVVVSSAFNATSLLASLYCSSGTAKHVIWNEGTRHTESTRGTLRNLLRRWLVPRAAGFWTNGPLSTALLDDYGRRSQPVQEGMIGTDGLFFHSATHALLPERDSIRKSYGIVGTAFLFVGRLVELKGVRQMTAAFRSAMGRAVGDVTLVLAGVGDMTEHLRRGLQGIQGLHVRILGSVPQRRLPELFAASDIFLLPTLADNWSLVALEAASAGLPQMFSVYNGASSDLMELGAAGLLFDPLNAQEFAQRLADVIASRPDRTPRAISFDIADHYSAENFASRGEALCRKVAQQC
jgi:glycosyltransferase involved in cell wall biosynthesis